MDLNALLNGERYVFAYAGTGAAMVFLSNNKKRLGLLRSHLSGFLSPMANQRLTKVL